MAPGQAPARLMHHDRHRGPHPQTVEYPTLDKLRVRATGHRLQDHAHGAIPDVGVVEVLTRREARSHLTQRDHVERRRGSAV